MSLVLFTGSFAVISNEIDWLIQSDMRVSPDGAMVSWGEMETAVRAYKPNDRLDSLSAMQGDHFAYRARMVDPHGRTYFVHVNQWTGEVTGTTPWLTVQRFFRDLHRYLFMPRNIGLPLVTSLAFILAISLYTGLKTTRNWRTIAMRLRLNKGIRIAVGDGHKAAGIWGSWFFVVIIVTSLWYLAEFGGGLAKHRFSPPGVSISDLRVKEYGAVINDASADELIAATLKVYPGLRPRVIRFAGPAKQAASVQGRTNDFLIRDRANQVYLDPVDAKVIKVQRANKIGVVAYLNEIADPLHFGYFGRLPTKIIWFVFGLALTGLSISGVWLTWKRLKTKRLSTAQLATFPILLAVIYCGTLWYTRIKGPKIAADAISFPVTFSEQIRGEIQFATDSNNIPTGALRLIFATGGSRLNIKSIAFNFPNKEGGEKPTMVNRLVANTVAKAELSMESLCRNSTLNIKIELNSNPTLENNLNLEFLDLTKTCAKK